MKYFIYNKTELTEFTFQSEWSCSHIDEKYIGSRPYLNNCYHHISNIDLLSQSSVDDCDYFIVPYYIRHTHHLKDEKNLKDFLNKNLKYFSAHPEKHIFFIGSDDTRTLKPLENSICFCVSAKKEDKSICLHYQPIVKPPTEISNIELCVYDISFQGYFSNDIRKKMEKAVKNMNSVVINVRYWFQKYMGYETTEMERNYYGLIEMSKFILCPKGYGTNSIRFFEAMSHGRIPVLISDNTKLPLENEIDYNSFIVRVAEKEIQDLPEIIERNKFDLKNKSIKARQIWDQYFKPEKFDFFMERSLNKTWLSTLRNG